MDYSAAARRYTTEKSYVSAKPVPIDPDRAKRLIEKWGPILDFTESKGKDCIANIYCERCDRVHSAALVHAIILESEERWLIRPEEQI